MLRQALPKINAAASMAARLPCIVPRVSAQMNRKSPSNRSFVLLLVLFVLASTALIAGAAELASRFLEPKVEGRDVVHLKDPTLGWLPKPGRYKITRSEFNVDVSINALNMNDREVSESDLKRENRILVLGDSHTFAVGASTYESWPKRLEVRLFANRETGTIWNAAVSAYSVGQYLARFRGLKDILRPNLVLVGFSMATDLYDLIPPEHGGFVYGGDDSRVYFDLGPGGELVEKVHASETSARKPSDNLDISLQIRQFLENFSLYRRLKRSNFAMWIAVHRPGGVSLWPGLDTALKKELTEDDKYRWLLAERILGKLVSEGRDSNAKVVIVNIPYLAQVYDATWAASFGARSDVYDRRIAGKRLAALCQRIGAVYIDTTEQFVISVRERHRWLHWPQDGHPTPEGQDVIAQVVADGIVKIGLIRDPQR
jgi:lysophospholipase L1-like esterase